MNEHLPDDLLGDIKRPNNSNQWFLSEQRKVKEEGGRRKEERGKRKKRGRTMVSSK